MSKNSVSHSHSRSRSPSEKPERSSLVSVASKASTKDDDKNPESDKPDHLFVEGLSKDVVSKDIKDLFE